MILACVLYMAGYKYLIFCKVRYKFLKKLYNNKKNNLWMKLIKHYNMF